MTRRRAPAPPRTRANPAADEINEYLWEVYQRQPAKKDRGGDFTWKDPAAANRMGKTLQAYVIVGMDADFRELVYHAGKAMDAAGIEWTIVSGFRDDWRQSIASGIKARTGFSRHGGSLAVGGYGHGRAVDIGHIDSAAQPRGVPLDRHQRREIRTASSVSLSIRRMWSRASTGAGWRRSCAASAPAASRSPRPRRTTGRRTRPAAKRKARNVRVAHAPRAAAGRRATAAATDLQSF